MGRRKHQHAVEVEEDDVDLNPLIDVIVLIMAFFILGGKLTKDVRTEEITVPPTKTAAKLDVQKDWQLIIVNVYGKTQASANQGTPEGSIRVGTDIWKTHGIDDFSAYIGLRHMLDKVYDHAEKYQDPKSPMQLPKVTLEIRADADTQYRIIQEIQQIVCDSIDPNNKMLPKQGDPKSMRPFVNINFTARLPFKEQSN